MSSPVSPRQRDRGNGLTEPKGLTANREAALHS